MTELEVDVRELRDEGAGIRRQQSETDLEQDAVIGGAIAHVAKLEAAVQNLSMCVGGCFDDQTATLATLASAVTHIMREAAGVLKRYAWLVKVGLVLGGMVAGAVIGWLRGH